MPLLPWLALGVFLLAFLGLITDATRDVRLRSGVLAAESGSDVPHLSKREPLRFLTTDIRRDGTSTTGWSGADGFLPAMAAGAAILFSSNERFGTTGSARHAGTPVAAYRSRAPPLSA
ncbi:hypothetical protein ABID21_002845 [Pseudorhizobium tarimense]|uniref:Uncharacterized protein n=1 Tax=Pseudorhizobium tarimense TaxID=1079109 RepID=A0ABV2H844_9HYPH|nr:hypothetical protein [Pseudorhizobium tarimense]MCJ8519870.1 hypothetical protein [Pseudorhizobium tarimense]